MTDATMSPITGGPESRAVTVRNPFAMGQGQAKGGDSLLSQIAKNTAMTVQILQSAMVGTPQEQAAEQAERQAKAVERREQKAEDSETDKGKGRLKGFVGAVGGLVRGTGRQLQKLNPFSSSFAFGNIGRLLLAGGGLALLRNFGDEFIDPLADMLQEISDKGIKKTLIETKDKIKKRLEPTLTELKENFDRFMDAIGRTITFVKSVYTQINDYIMSFDTKGKKVPGATGQMIEVGDGIIDDEELGFLRQDLQKRAVDTVGGYFKALFDEVKFKILTGLFAITGARLLLNSLAVSSIFGGGAAAAGATAAAGAATRGSKTAKMSAGKLFGIAALLAYGITSTYSNFESSMEESLEKNKGNFDFSTFISTFLGGADNAGGSAAKAYEQGLSGAGTGFLAGAAIGSVIPGVGTIVGGLFGMMAGGIIFALSGSAGTDRVKAITDDILKTADNFVVDIGNFFTDIAAGFASFFKGEGFMKGFERRKHGDVDEMTKEVNEKQALLNTLKMYQEQNPSEDFSDVIAEAETALAEAKMINLAAPSLGQFNEIGDMLSERKSMASYIRFLRGRIFTDPGDSNKDGSFGQVKKTGLLRAEYQSGRKNVDPQLIAYTKKQFGREPTNLDAYQYYTMQAQRLDSKIYTKSRNLALDETAMSIKSDYESGNLGTNIMTSPVLNTENLGVISSTGSVADGNAVTVVSDNSQTNNEVRPMTLNFDDLSFHDNSTAAVLGSTRLITLTGID